MKITSKMGPWYTRPAGLLAESKHLIHNPEQTQHLKALPITWLYYHSTVPFIMMMMGPGINHSWGTINTLRPRQNACHFADGIFKCILLNEKVWISFKTSQKFVSKVRINNIPAYSSLVGAKTLSESMMVRLLSLGLNELSHRCFMWSAPEQMVE